MRVHPSRKATQQPAVFVPLKAVRSPVIDLQHAGDGTNEQVYSRGYYCHIDASGLELADHIASAIYQSDASVATHDVIPVDVRLHIPPPTNIVLHELSLGNLPIEE
ncbi:uncharacterized protein METZ01_LOCUS30654 [marine metagenome]|uniref:Uncharacterized protein n=1 Tax=marine metagenome TaxID=408172 RepID=A0A381QFP3_9ZZZZ